MNTTIPDARRDAVGESLYLAIFRVTAIADLAGPVRAVEWAQSLLDDEQLRAAFISGVSSDLVSRRRESEEPGGAGHAFGDRRAEIASSPNLLAGGRPRSRDWASEHPLRQEAVELRDRLPDLGVE